MWQANILHNEKYKKYEKYYFIKPEGVRKKIIFVEGAVDKNAIAIIAKFRKNIQELR